MMSEIIITLRRKLPQSDDRVVSDPDHQAKRLRGLIPLSVPRLYSCYGCYIYLVMYVPVTQLPLYKF